MKRYLILFISCIVLSSIFLCGAFAEEKDVLSKSDKQFLDKLMRGTFNSMMFLVDEKGGLPENTQRRDGFSNSTPIGYYISTLAIGAELGLIDKEEAAKRFDKALTTMESVDYKFGGFFQNFINMDGTPTWENNHVMIISDYNFYPVGLIHARNVFPQFKDRINKYLDSIEWERMYNKKTNKIYSGYDLKAGKGVIEGLWLASDARCAVVMMIGSGACPPNVWENMIRGKMDSKFGDIYAPGFGFGATYISAFTGIFMDERDTEVGKTVGNLGWYQYDFSVRRGYPLWGWSNCMIPEPEGMYTVGGYIPEWCVTPHALALLLDYYPRHVTAALKRMKELGGDIPPEKLKGKEFGFRGCYNMQNDKWGNLYLPLEQGSLFLALANYLHDGIVRDIFQKDPLIAKGLELSKPFIKHEDKWLKLWKERDSQPIAKTPLRMAKKKDAAETSVTLDLTSMRTGNPNIAKLTKNDGAVNVSVDGKKDWTTVGLRLVVPNVDIQHMDRLELELEFKECDVKAPGYMYITLLDKFNQSRLVRVKLKKDQSLYKISAREIYGFFLDDDVLKSISLAFPKKPVMTPYHSFKANSFKATIKNIRIVNVK